MEKKRKARELSWVHTIKTAYHCWPWLPGWGSIYQFLHFASVIESLSRVLSLQPHGLQHTRLPCPLPSPGACPNSCPLSQWCYPTISSSVVPSPPAFSLSQHQGLFQWGHQVAKVWRFSFSISPSNGYSGLISFSIVLFDLLVVQGTLKSLLQHHNQQHQFFHTQPSLWSRAHGERCHYRTELLDGNDNSLKYKRSWECLNH